MTARGVIVAGTSSGVGKTTIATAIAGALRARGLRVQPFKTGPDYIDPTYLARAAGIPCRNLDTWMLPADTVCELFARAAAAADVAMVEGVMGLFDGADDGTGSAAHLARLLGLPVVLVVDARAMAQSSAAIVLGFQRFDPEVRVAGVILNRVASARHAEICRKAILANTGVPVLGAIPRDEEATIPERHLGLVPDVETPAAQRWFDGLARLAATHVDLDTLLTLAAPVAPVEVGQPVFPATSASAVPRARIAIARDEAFHFYYQDSLDLLEAHGAELVPFSPLADAALPPCDAVYIGGGFPELFAADLSRNAAMREAMRGAAASALPIYGECGGLMYLGGGIADFEGTRHEMTGLIPAESVMQGTRLTLGYREVESCGTPLLAVGERLRGHEFHWSALAEPPAASTAAYRVLDQDGRPDGYRAGSVTATYVHAHLAARRDLAPNFIAAAEAARAAR